MPHWTESIHSDGTRGFVSNPLPKLGEDIQISARCLADAPVREVYLLQMKNGAENWIPMKKDRQKSGLQYYVADVHVNENRLAYHFAFTTDDEIYFYNQFGVQTYLPDEKHDFVILADYHQPAWVKGAVFYQIFPDRFHNGCEKLNVKDGEYTYRGHGPVLHKDWNEAPLSWEEGHGMDFFGGDLYGIITKIPYLKCLGITAIYLNPIFTAYSTHKYDCIDYFHVDPHFGGDEALAQLSSALHENDIRLILDISINHTGIEHTWVKEHPEFYFRKEDGSFLGWAGVETLPVLDYRNEELRELVYAGENSVLRKWLKAPYSIDGWRFDVADVLARNDDVQLAGEIWPEICKAIREENPDAFIIGEHWGDCSEYLQGDQWNTPMNYYGFGRILRQFAGLPDLFLDRNPGFRGIPYRMSAADVSGRTRDHYSVLPQVIADAQMNLYDSHDIPRLHNDARIDENIWKMATSAQLLWTGIPCIYYGDEMAIDGYTEADAGFRYPMPWENLTENGIFHSETIHTLARLRRTVSAFAEGGRKELAASGRILAVARFLEDEIYCGVLSMEDEEQEILLPLELVGAKEPDGAVDAFGAPIYGELREDGYLLTVPARGVLLFRCEPI